MRGGAESEATTCLHVDGGAPGRNGAGDADRGGGGGGTDPHSWKGAVAESFLTAAQHARRKEEEIAAIKAAEQTAAKAALEEARARLAAAEEARRVAAAERERELEREREARAVVWYRLDEPSLTVSVFPNVVTVNELTSTTSPTGPNILKVTSFL